jgi:hypothetical protein
MEDLGMKTILALAAVVLTLTSIPLFAQQVDADASASAYANTGAAKGGFGDEAASRSWEMTSVTGELQGKLDSKTAKPGDQVMLKTTEKAQASDGAVIPKGSRLIGHVTEVQPHTSDRTIAQVGIAFDRAELKNGQSLQVHSLIRTIRPGASVTAMDSMGSDDSIGAGMSGGGMGSGRMGGGSRGGVVGGAAGGALGASGNATAEAGNLGAGTVNGTVDRNGNSTIAGAGTNVGAGGIGARDDTAVQLAGHGDGPVSGGAHAAAAARAVPHSTGVPGVMLAGSSTSSGLFIDSDRREIQLESGTRFELGVVADR